MDSASQRKPRALTTVPNDRDLPLLRCLAVDLEVTKQDHRICAFAGVRWDRPVLHLPGHGRPAVPSAGQAG